MPRAKEAQIPLSVEKIHQLQGDNSGPIDQPSHDTTSAAENIEGTEHDHITRQEENKVYEKMRSHKSESMHQSSLAERISYWLPGCGGEGHPRTHICASGDTLSSQMRLK